MQHIAVARHHNGHDGDPRLNGQMKRALLKRQQRGLLGIASRALGKNIHALFLVSDLRCRPRHRLSRILRIASVDKHRAAQTHKPAQERNVLQTLLGRHGTVLREDAAQHEHVQLGLMVSDEDGGARGAEVVVGVLDVEGYARGEPHGPFEGAGDGPLGDAVISHEAEEDGYEDAVARAEDEGKVAGEETGEEAGEGKDCRDHVEGQGVLALQGAFNEHIQLLRSASQILATSHQPPDLEVKYKYSFIEVRNESELNSCDALIIPGGESTAISLVAQRSGLLEPLRDFVKLHRRPTWGTCAGLILLSESANRTKAGGQELIGGLDVRVNRNHFGRQVESFSADLNLPFLSSPEKEEHPQGKRPIPFPAIFIRAPIVEKLLAPHSPNDIQTSPSTLESNTTITAPSISPSLPNVPVEILATLPGRTASLSHSTTNPNLPNLNPETGDIVAVRQANVFGTSFHPELTGDARIHAWWLERVIEDVVRRRRV
ncbi:hypothetical protein DSL72_003970 [Monilinia vaccinii-corymbosi]|uniref:glutaminase n=1 Tax=Monilinia vaccinii-corymbosi TaxID=61207 RepID=A0A8A3P2Q8_9HELO|nr:hypothetical protein DSL72_003970 [Monilinia vaccinii-corymbosi]